MNVLARNKALGLEAFDVLFNRSGGATRETKGQPS